MNFTYKDYVFYPIFNTLFQFLFLFCSFYNRNAIHFFACSILPIYAYLFLKPMTLVLSLISYIKVVTKSHLVINCYGVDKKSLPITKRTEVENEVEQFKPACKKN